jgi:hypothetical protein
MIAARERIKPVLWTPLLLCTLAAPVYAGVKVKGDVDQVAEQVEQAFEELEIETAESSRDVDRAMAVGTARSGARVMVSVEHLGDDECELSVSTDDQDIEARFLRLMQTR